MNHVNRIKLKAVALLLAALASANSAWALNPGDILTIQRYTPGGVDLPSLLNVCPTIGNTHPAPAGMGSCFGMEIESPSILQKRLRGYNGIVIGSAQPASGSHGGVPTNPLSESPGIDLPWEFFTNTGMHFTSSPVTVLTNPTLLAPNGVLDFSGWAVTWNSVPNIPMGSGAHGAGFVDGQAQIVCNPGNCPNGATYTLAYTATVPPGSGTDFDGVIYSLRLEGYVVAPALVTSAPAGITAGGIGGATAIRVTEAELSLGGIPVDSGYSHSGGYYDFRTPTPGGTTQVVLPLTAALPANFVYRKYNTTTNVWHTFVEDANNNIRSAAGSLGSSCPPPGDISYQSPATAGHYCLQLTIEDGGPNDADVAANGFVRDPGGVATALGALPSAAASGSSGCSLSTTPVNPLDRGDWWLLLGLVTWMGVVIRRKRA